MDPRVEVEIARRTLVDGWQSFSRAPGNAWSIAKHTLADTRDENGKHIGGGQGDNKSMWHTIPDRILSASPHLQGYDVPGDEIDKLKAQGLTLLEALEELGIG